jgi:hypothetical protein
MGEGFRVRASNPKLRLIDSLLSEGMQIARVNSAPSKS